MVERHKLPGGRTSVTERHRDTEQQAHPNKKLVYQVVASGQSRYSRYLKITGGDRTRTRSTTRLNDLKNLNTARLLEYTQDQLNLSDALVLGVGV